MDSLKAEIRELFDKLVAEGEGSIRRRQYYALLMLSGEVCNIANELKLDPWETENYQDGM